MKTPSLLISRLLIVPAITVTGLAAEPTSKLTIKIQDEQGRPVPARVHLANSNGEAQKVEGLPFWHDHVTSPGDVTFTLAPGSYRFAVERGPEYARETGECKLAEGQAMTRTITVARFVDLGAQGYFAGDLHVHRPIEQIELLMTAEDLRIAPVVTWWNRTNHWTGRDLPAPTVREFPGKRFSDLMAGEDERGGGALLFLGLERPLDLSRAEREWPSPMQFVNEARRRDPGVWIDVEKPFWWDVPTWVASGQVQSFSVAHNQFNRAGILDNEAWGRARDRNLYPTGPRGYGLWTQEIYYRVLNSGVRIPPSSGSASGVLPNPVGYNRVYVPLAQGMDHDAWWDGLRRGRSFVTNGPLLRVRAKGAHPGEVFRSEDGSPLVVDLDVELDSVDPVKRLEILRDGRVVQEIALDDPHHGKVSAKLTIPESGWFLVRAIADVPETFRFATTAPWYVEIGATKHRVSRSASRFFLEWVEERMRQLGPLLPDDRQRREVLAEHEKAREFWKSKLDTATAD